VSGRLARVSGRPAPTPVLVALVACVGAGCASLAFRPPTGVGRPAPDAPDALAEASADCRNARTFTGQTHLSGQVGEDRLAVGLDVGLTAADQIYLVARAMGTERLWLSGSRVRATLYLAADRAALTAPAEEIVEALIGVRLTPSRLLAMLTGCLSRDLSIVRAERFDGLTAVTTPDGTVYLERRQRRWQVRGGTVDGFIVGVTHPPLATSFPSELQVRSDPGQVPAVDLRVRVGPQFAVNQDIQPAAFTRTPPTGTGSITLDDLRAAGPLRARDGGM